MARIRTIKPEFPQSESIGKLSRDARLLYIQLWTIVDDAGRARAASRMLASLLYPYDDDARDLIDEWLTELEHGGHIRRYEVDGSQYLEIVKWLEHQKIDKPSKSRLPEFVANSRTVANPREESATDLGPSTVDLGPSKPSASRSRAIENPDFEEFWKAFPRRDGPNPRKTAEQKFCALVKTGVEPRVMIDAAKQLAADEAKRGNIGTRFIPMAATWLNQQRWSDHAAAVFASQDDGMIEVTNQDQLDAWDEYGRQTRGSSYPRNRVGGWRFPSKWPPGYEQKFIADVEALAGIGGRKN